jgi:hypothetical protein
MRAPCLKTWALFFLLCGIPGGFITAGLHGAENARAVIRARIFPNPAPGAQARLAFTMPQSGQASLSIYNSAGWLCATLDRHLDAGPVAWDLDLRGLACGTYHVLGSLAYEGGGQAKLTGGFYRR